MPPTSLLLLLLLLLLFLPLAAPTPSTPTPTASLAHCECRCCHHDLHLRTICSSNVSSIPLPPGLTCDAPLPSASTCGPQLCRTSFPTLCPAPSFLKHACVSDRGFLRDWLPLAFAFCALVALACGAASRARKGPHRDAAVDGFEEAMAYKREPVPYDPALPENAPLLAKGGQVLVDDGAAVEVVDVAPRSPTRNSPNVQVLGSPVTSYSLPYANCLSPMRTALTASASASAAYGPDPRRVASYPVPAARGDRTAPATDETVT